MNGGLENLSARLDSILSDIEETCRPRQYARFIVPFMLDCAALVEQRMPPLALEAIQIAKGYRDGLISLQHVAEIRDACWQSITGPR